MFGVKNYGLEIVLVLTALGFSQVPANLQSDTPRPPGPPRNPLFFSQISLILQSTGILAAPQPSPKGPVAEVRWEKSQLHIWEPDKPISLARIITIKYDKQQHEIDRSDEDTESLRKSKSRTVTTYRDGRLQAREYYGPGNGGPPYPAQWTRWSYDPEGRIMEIRSGTGTELHNHYLNYKYDAHGRLTAFEYRQGAKDEPFSHTEIEYNGILVHTQIMEKDFGVQTSEAQALDDSGHVVELRYSEPGDKIGERRLFHVAFKYDDKGRVVEQVTDPFKLQSGDDSEPIPGKVVVRYDDEKHSRDLQYFDPDGKMALHVTYQLDRDGEICSLRVFDSNGKEKPPSTAVANLKTKHVEERGGKSEWEVVYDEHGNWTERRLWFTPADGTPRIMTQLVRQEITYR
jgi:hypothetical protein